ncbi:DUF2585 family protein [Falsiroseomonas selenitidurans]|uniref:UPF0314 protein HEQ75_17805 n=1 Tax=Falsiroseomonas selenitidurans TaxID=2716335 RepID=A0ABX1ECW3_9PROT|nr:DUF2585 family protein [Falsiroseomonas selenitidurans]NKC32725.1 DUF2585 domain-containing protein [Falsiroseomonas selenitidurans]
MPALPRWAWLVLLLGLLVATALILLAMGREPICTCGSIKLWHGEVISAENSQHITDWYTPSHIGHGLIFYAALHLVARRLGLLPRAVIATVVEAAWEILENTDAVIRHYREATIALDYFGDSVLNSGFDIAAMWLGFALAARLPVWASVALLLAMEVGVALVIRDNLTLNVLMLLWPLDAVREWQAAR